jgi:hypothetical protein
MIRQAGKTAIQKKHRAILAAALFLFSPPAAPAQAPEEAMRAFYAWALAHPSRALPSARQRTELANVLAPDLLRLLKAASETEARCLKSAPKGEKPLLMEGDLFVGNHEGATEVAYGEPRRRGETAIVESDLLYIDKRFPRAHKNRARAWKDQLELRLQGARWLVQDVHFPQDRSLAAELKAYIDEGRRSCSVR